MSRFLLLIPFILWKATEPSVADVSSGALISGALVFLTVYVMIVLILGLWCRIVARRVAPMNLNRSLWWFNQMVTGARVAIPVWFGVGIYLLNWRDIAGPLNHLTVQLPAMLVGTLPAMLAWVGLWWAQYPSDRAMREQSMLNYLEENLPLRSPPTLGAYLLSNLRIQLLFTIVPVMFIVAMRDIALGTLAANGTDITGERGQTIEGIVSLFAVTAVFLLAPEILKRVLHTQSLPSSALRDRLEAICRRHRLGFRDILLWHTDNNMGNAAVMGLFPQVRYVLMSDLLLETMTDEQIEAVFAHEIGHVVYWHMAWYVVFMLIFFCVLNVIGAFIPRSFRYADQSMLAAAALLFVPTFGFLSRRFERQADVFAARTMESVNSRRMRAETIASAVAGDGFVMRSALPPMDEGEVAPPSYAGVATADAIAHDNGNGDSHSYVGPYGAAVFASALHRVAVINSIPISGRNWSHGSIEKRMDYLHSISSNPTATARFDRVMFWLYVTMLVLLSTFGAWAVMQGMRSG